MQEHGEVHHMRRSCPIQELCQCMRILRPSSLPCHSRHNVGVIDHTRLVQTLNGFICLSLVVILLHECKHIIQPALDTKIQMPYAKPTEGFKLGVRPPSDARHRRVHIDLFAFREILPDHLKNLNQPVILLGKCVPVSKKNPLRVPADSFDPF